MKINWEEVYEEYEIDFEWMINISLIISKQICYKRGLYNAYGEDIRNGIIEEMLKTLELILSGKRKEPKGMMNYMFLVGVYHGERLINEWYYKQPQPLNNNQLFLFDELESDDYDDKIKNISEEEVINNIEFVNDLYNNKELFTNKQWEWIQLNKKGYSWEQYCKETGLSRSMYWKRKNDITRIISKEYKNRR